MSATAGAIKAGRAFIELFADKSKLVKDLKIAESEVRKFGVRVAGLGAGLMAAGGAVLGSLVGAAKVFADYGDGINKASDRTGAAVSDLAELQYAADQSGSSLEGVETGMKGMSKTIAEAAAGSKPAIAALSALGLSAQELLKLSVADRFTLIGDRISGIQDGSLRAAAAMDVFGKAGMGLLPMFSAGAAGVSALRREAQSLGVSLSKEQADAATAMGDAIGMFTTSVKQATVAVGSALAPTITSLAKALSAVTASAGRWLKENRALVTTVAAIAAGLIVAGGVLFTVGVTIAGVSVAVSGLTIGLGAMATVAGAAWLALTGPIGLAVVGITALTAAVLYFSGAGSAIAESFGAITSAIGDVIDALTNGSTEDALALWGIAFESQFAKIRAGFASLIGDAAGKAAAEAELFGLGVARELLRGKLKKPPGPGELHPQDEGGAAPLAMPKFTTAGTFSASAVGGMFGGGIATDIRVMRVHLAKIEENGVGILRFWNNAIKQIGFAKQDIPLSIPKLDN